MKRLSINIRNVLLLTCCLAVSGCVGTHVETRKLVHGITGVDRLFVISYINDLGSLNVYGYTDEFAGIFESSVVEKFRDIGVNAKVVTFDAATLSKHDGVIKVPSTFPFILTIKPTHASSADTFHLRTDLFRRNKTLLWSATVWNDLPPFHFTTLDKRHADDIGKAIVKRFNQDGLGPNAPDEIYSN